MCAFFIKTARLQAPAKSLPGKELGSTIVRNQREQQGHVMHAYMRVTHHSRSTLDLLSNLKHMHSPWSAILTGCQFAKSTHEDLVQQVCVLQHLITKFGAKPSIHILSLIVINTLWKRSTADRCLIHAETVSLFPGFQPSSAKFSLC